MLDRELETTDREPLKEAVLASPGARAVHDARIRDAGDRVFIEFRLEVDGAIAVVRAHDVAGAAEKAAGALFSEGAQVAVRIGPAGIRDERLDDDKANGKDGRGRGGHD